MHTRPLDMPEDNKSQVPINAQPYATTPMSAGGNRNALNRQLGADGQREWSHGLFDCVDDCGLCCLSVWCPCVVFSKSRQRIQHLQSHGTPLQGDGETFNGDCLIYGCLAICGYGWILQIGNRANTRTRYSVRGDVIADCFSSWCCQPCALTQERREIELEENSFEGFSRSK